MQSVLQDIRFAARRLVKDRWFTLAAIAALALGIGANSAVFTLVNAVLLRGLPFDEPDRIMMIDWRDTRGRNFGNSLDDFDDLRRASKTFSGMSLVFNGALNISGDDKSPEQYPGVYISANGFSLIGETAALGRAFGPEDDLPARRRSCSSATASGNRAMRRTRQLSASRFVSTGCRSPSLA